MKIGVETNRDFQQLLTKRFQDHLAMDVEYTGYISEIKGNSCIITFDNGANAECEVFNLYQDNILFICGLKRGEYQQYRLAEHLEIGTRVLAHIFRESYNPEKPYLWAQPLKCRIKAVGVEGIIEQVWESKENNPNLKQVIVSICQKGLQVRDNKNFVCGTMAEDPNPGEIIEVFLHLDGSFSYEQSKGEMKPAPVTLRRFVCDSD